MIAAVRNAQLIGKLAIITTDLFPPLVAEPRAGTVAASIFHRPRARGRTAFRLLYEHMTDRSEPVSDVSFAPHVVMRGNFELFLTREQRPATKSKRRSAIHADHG